jgi:hypothetical protein
MRVEILFYLSYLILEVSCIFVGHLDFILGLLS